MSAIGNRLRAELRAWIDGAFSGRKQEKIHRTLDALDAEDARIERLGDSSRAGSNNGLEEAAAFVKRYDVAIGWSDEDEVYIAGVINASCLIYIKAHGLTPIEAIRELAVATDLALSVIADDTSISAPVISRGLLTQDAAACTDPHKHCADLYREDPLGFVCAPDCPGPSMAAQDEAEENNGEDA